MSMSLEQVLQLLRESDSARAGLVSLAWIAVILAIRSAGLRVVRATVDNQDPERLRWTVQVKRITIILLVLGLGLIWATEIQTMALSVTAIAVALVIATKEMLLCVMGAVLRVSARSFSVGDRIEIGGARGDVIDHGLFATTIVEVGPTHNWTGRAITVPNSMMLDRPVVNETFSHAYVLHIISLPVDLAALTDGVEEMLVQAGEEICAPFLAQARASLSTHAEDRGLEQPNTKPHVTLQVPSANSLTLLLRLPVPARDKGDIEQQVLRRFVAWQSSRPQSGS